MTADGGLTKDMAQDLHVMHMNYKRWRIATIIFVLLSIGLLVALIVVAHQSSSSSTQKSTFVLTDDSEGLCGKLNPNGNFIDLREPAIPGPFHDLTVEELTKLTRFLEDDPNIKAAKSKNALINSSYIFQMDLYLPRKADVLNYLDKSGPRPERRARVIMFRGDLTPPMVHEYICGPFPVLKSCDLLNSTRRRNPIEFNLRPPSNKEFAALHKFLQQVDKQIYKDPNTPDTTSASTVVGADLTFKIGYILKEAYGVTWTQCEKQQDCFSYGVSQMGSGISGDVNQRKMWLDASYTVPFPSLHPVDHALLCNLNSSNVSEWTLVKIWFAGDQFNSVDELISSYNNGSIKMQNYTQPVETDDLYSTLHRRGDPVPPKPQRPPMQVEPDGKRYSLKDRKVEYLGWSFNFRMSALSGPAIFDVRFQGERIAYEISLAEIAVFYSGNTPPIQITNYVDSGVLLGSNSKSLVPGADCPDSATLVNQTFFENWKGEPIVYTASFCLFEHNNGYPLRRHMSYTEHDGSFYGGLSDSVLILRSALTLENYDYIIDFIFHLNGMFEGRFMSTGYIISTPYSESARPYGFNIENNILGNLHHHLVHFKVDLDIGGTSNRYETLDITPEAVPLVLDQTQTFHQTKFTHNPRKTEAEAVFDYNFDNPKYHVVYNNASRTKFNEYRAYRILMNGMSKVLFAEGQGNEQAVAWARHQLVVTKHNDEEFLSSSNYGMYDSLNPVVNFTSFYADNDNIEDEDLVFWIACGLHHIPHTEDLPVTPTVGNHLTFFLLPYNFFTQCPSMGSRDAIYIQHIDPLNPTKGVKVDRYGNTRDQCVTPRSTLEEDVARNPDQVLKTTP